MAEENNNTVCSVCMTKTDNKDRHPITGETILICTECLDQLFDQISGEDLFILEDD